MIRADRPTALAVQTMIAEPRFHAAFKAGDGCKVASPWLAGSTHEAKGPWSEIAAASTAT